jgi:hypothetical protein
VRDDSSQPPEHLGVDLCHVYALVCTSYWLYKMNCSSLHVMNTVKTVILSENDISCAQTWSWGVGEFNCYFPVPSWVFPRGRERPGRDADPSPPSIAVVVKE